MLTTGKIEDLRIKDYDSFGMITFGRSWEVGSGHRYGFNGKESDSETYGDGNVYDYGFRVYNPMLGKFLSMDPYRNKYPMLTTYQFASNCPIKFIDLDGLEATEPEYPQEKSIIEVSTSPKVLEYKEKALEEFRQTLDYEIEPGLKPEFGLSKIKLGPINLSLTLAFWTISESKSDNLSGELINCTINARVVGVDLNASGSVGSYEFNEEGKMEVKPGSTQANVEAGPLNADDDGNIGYGVNLFGTKVSGSINLVHLTKALGYTFAWGSQIIFEKFKNIFNGNRARIVIDPTFLERGEWDNTPKEVE